MKLARIPLAVAALAATLLPGAALALSDSAVSAADTLDSRAPLIALVHPVGGEIFTGADTETLRWTIDEQSWAGNATPVTVRVYEGAMLLDEDSVSPKASGVYAYPWSVADVNTFLARVEVSAADRFGWDGEDVGGDFTIHQSGVAAPPMPLPDRLGPVSPNPFNPSTRIAFTLSARAEIGLAVYDTRGREIARLADGPWPAGAHTVTWHGRNDAGAPVASGTYLARLYIRGGDGTARPDDLITRLTLVR